MAPSAPAMGEKAWIAKTVSPCSELRLDHTKSLKCSTPKLVPFLALRERNSEHRHRQPRGWSQLINKCGARTRSKSQIRHRLLHS